MTEATKKFYNAKTTLETVEFKTDSRGREYIKMRGSIARNDKAPIIRTLKAVGKAADEVREAAIPGAVVNFRGLYERVGAEGGEFFTVTGLAREPQAAAA